MEYPIRPVTEAELLPFFEGRAAGFGETVDPTRFQHTHKYADLTRTLAVWDNEQVVGTTGAWTFDMSVPGGHLPCAGVTWVAVRPTHRRQGILTAMMRRQLADIHERGEPIAMLWASEVPIYGRYGYGLTAEGVEMKIERTRTALLPGIEPTGRARMVSRERALATWPGVYDAVRESVPAMHSRSAEWWDYRVLREDPTHGPGLGFLVEYTEGDTVLGYVRYKVKEKWDEGGGAAFELSVLELMATTDAAYAALWRFIFSVDLVGTIHAEWRRTDEPLYHMLADSRRLYRRPSDTVFCRIVDPIAALSGRRYATEGRVVLELTDPFCEWVNGRYLLEGGPEGATCTRTTLEPDIFLTATELGAIYFGHTRLTPLLRAGRICATDPATHRADAMFAWHTHPWSPEIW